MKQLVSLMLVLVMLMCAAPAVAESVPDGVFAMNADAFCTYYTLFVSSALAETPTRTDDASLLTLTCDSLLPVTLHLNEDGQITRVTCATTAVMEDLDASLEPLSSTIYLLALSALMAETNDVRALQTAAATADKDLLQLFNAVPPIQYLSEQQLKAGVSSTGTVMGYPAQMTVQAASVLSRVTICHCEFALMPPGAAF